MDEGQNQKIDWGDAAALFARLNEIVARRLLVEHLLVVSPSNQILLSWQKNLREQHQQGLQRARALGFLLIDDQEAPTQ